MKKFWITLSALGVLAFGAGWLWSSGIPNIASYGGGLGYYNQQSGDITDVNGAQYVTDVSSGVTYTNAINDTVSQPGVMDSRGNSWSSTWSSESTAVIQMGPYRRATMWLIVRPVSAIDSTSVYRLAVQVRGQLTSTQGDTTSMMPWLDFANSISAFPTSGAISPGTDSTATAYPSTGTAQTMSYLWDGEREFTFIPARVGLAGATIKTNASFGWPGGMVIPLQDRFGRYFWAPYMSIRVRLLTSSLASTSAKPRIQVHLALGS